MMSYVCGTYKYVTGRILGFSVLLYNGRTVRTAEVTRVSEELLTQKLETGNRIELV